MAGDLVGGGYPLGAALRAMLGQNGNEAQSNIPIRSNLEYTGFASIADGAALVTNKLIFVPVPVDPGEYSAVTFIPGNTAPTVTIGYAAVYSGLATGATSLLLAQSANIGSTAPAAQVPYTFALTSPIIVNPTTAPFGYVFVGIQETGTVNSAASVSIAAAVDGTVGAWFTNAPFMFGGEVAATTGTAPANLGSPTGVTIKPIVFLS